MRTLHLLLHITAILGLAACAPYESQEILQNFNPIDPDSLNENLQQTQDHEDFYDDSQQKTQLEDLHQQDHIPTDLMSGRLENFNQESDDLQQSQKHDPFLSDYTQQIQAERLHRFPEPEGQLSADLEQQSQVEDLNQYQGASDRLENLDNHEDDVQQTQNQDTFLREQYREQTQNLHETPYSDDIQQVQDHDRFTDEKHIEDMNQFNQLGKIHEMGELADTDDTQQTQELYQQEHVSNDQQSGRLEDMTGDTQLYLDSQTQEKQLEDYNQELGQIRESGYEQENAEIFGGSEQETQHEDLLLEEQVDSEPKIPELPVSQVRHEQPYGYKVPDLPDSGGSQYTNSGTQDGSISDYGVEEQGKVQVHDQPSYYPQNGGKDDFHVDHSVPTSAPGFWRRLGSKIETAYNKAKDKGRHIIHKIKESVG